MSRVSHESFRCRSCKSNHQGELCRCSRASAYSRESCVSKSLLFRYAARLRSPFPSRSSRRGVDRRANRQTTAATAESRVPHEARQRVGLISIGREFLRLPVLSFFRPFLPAILPPTVVEIANLRLQRDQCTSMHACMRACVRNRAQSRIQMLP